MAEEKNKAEINSKTAKAKTEKANTAEKKTAVKTASKPVAKKTAATDTKAVKSGTAAKTVAKKPAAKTATVKTVEKASTAKPAKAATALKEDVKVKDVNTSAAKQKAERKADKDAKYIKVTLTKSIIGCKKYQIATVKALGLNKIRQSKILQDNKQSRGMINKVSHLVSVNEVKQEA